MAQYFEVAVGVADGIIAPANPNRRLAILSNAGTADIYLAFGHAATVGHSLRLPAGGDPVDLTDVFPGLLSAEVHAIASAAGGALAGFVDQ